MKIPYQKLVSFLEAANKSTYADKDALKARSTRLHSEDYHFEKGDLVFHDTYFGGRNFIGEEIVYQDKKPVWGMNYYGYVLNSSISEQEIYGFLRKVLLQKYSDIIPVRGASEYGEYGWKYINKPYGNLRQFNGIEEIYIDEMLVYRGNYHGGTIE